MPASFLDEVEPQPQPFFLYGNTPIRPLFSGVNETWGAKVFKLSASAHRLSTNWKLRDHFQPSSIFRNVTEICAVLISNVRKELLRCLTLLYVVISSSKAFNISAFALDKRESNLVHDLKGSVEIVQQWSLALSCCAEWHFFDCLAPQSSLPSRFFSSQTTASLHANKNQKFQGLVLFEPRYF